MDSSPGCFRHTCSHTSITYECPFVFSLVELWHLSKIADANFGSKTPRCQVQELLHLSEDKWHAYITFPYRFLFVSVDHHTRVLIK
jgi:hypothetical protein